MVPAESFSFSSKAKWPTSDNYESDVLDGVLDALVGSGFYLCLGVSIILEEMGWHDVDSAPVAYYEAARQTILSYLSGVTAI
jgi:hypothetical protein